MIQKVHKNSNLLRTAAKQAKRTGLEKWSKTLCYFRFLEKLKF